MQTTARPYDHPADYERVSRFLVRTFRAPGRHVNWQQPRWEYMHYHPLIRGVELGSIGIWESQGEIVGVVHPEHDPGTVYFELAPDRGDLREEMLAFAETHLWTERDGARRLRIFIIDGDEELQKLAAARGFVKTDEFETMSEMAIPDRFPPAPLPPGFRLQSLADDNDLGKVTRVFWRGFNHGDEPPDELDDRRLMQSAPSYRKELNLVVVAPDGEFACYCGMWYEPDYAIAYVEPVATDPDHRRLGLARAAVREGIRRCGDLGAGVAYVGSAQPLYSSLGFRPVYTSSVWTRERRRTTSRLWAPSR